MAGRGRPAGSRNRRTVLAFEDVDKAQRQLAKVYGDSIHEGGIAKSIPMLLWEMTRSTYDNSTRIQAAKELARLRYAQMGAIAVDTRGEAVVKGADDAPEQMSIELFDDAKREAA